MCSHFVEGHRPAGFSWAGREIGGVQWDATTSPDRRGSPKHTSAVELRRRVPTIRNFVRLEEIQLLIHLVSRAASLDQSDPTDATCQTRRKGDADGARTDNGDVDLRRPVLWQRVTG